MTRGKKILATIAGSVAGLLVVIIIVSILVLRSGWFANFVREKVIAAIEDSTGGLVEIGAFQFNWTHLTVRIRNFVLHGTEPQGSDPLARLALLELRLKLFTGLTKPVDLEYLGIEQPQVNFIVFPNGKTNVPEPKVKSKPSQTSGLQTVVDLAIRRFQIENGVVKFAQQKAAFSARGENLRALLNYNASSPSYQGNLSIDPLLLTSGARPPLAVHVNLPITIEKDAVRLSGAKFNTDQSQIAVNAGIENLKAPQISAELNASLSLPELERSMGLPIDTNARHAPKTLSAQAQISIDEKSNIIQVHRGHLGLGQTTFEASGTLDPSKNSAIRFDANFALDELASLFKVSSIEATGAVEANGNAKLDTHNNYSVDGTLNSRGLSVRSGSTRLSDLRLYSPFHADPDLISLDGLRFNALGGSLGARVLVEKMQQLRAEATFRDFSLPVLATVFTGKQLGYDGTISGAVDAKGDLNAKGTRGYTSQAKLSIAPGNHGVPVSARLSANYAGARDLVSIEDSYISLPNTRVDLSGSLNQEIDVHLVSRDLNDFLPAANFGAAKPQPSLPIALEGGNASLQAQITGDIAAPRIAGHLAMDRFAVEQRSFDQFGLDLAASPSEATIRNGLLNRKALRTTFEASIGLQKWSPVPRSPLSANLALRNGDVADLMSLAGTKNVPASGQLSADVHLNGTYGNPSGEAQVEAINGTIYQQPFSRFLTNVNLSDQLVTLTSLELDTTGGQLNVNGTYRHPRETFATGHALVHVSTSGIQLANIKPLQQENAAIAGQVQLTADAAADLKEANQQSDLTISNISADLSARGLRVEDQSAGDLNATARTVNGNVQFNVASNFAGSNISVNGRTGLAKDYPTTADASIENLSVEKTLSIVGQSAVPARGNFSAKAHVAGTLQAPDANVTFALERANVYQEPINRLGGNIRYANTLVEIPSLELVVPAGNVTLSGSFTHPANNFNDGSLKLKLGSSDIQVAKFEHVARQEPTLAGTFHLAADISANVREQKGSRAVLVSNANADISAKGLRMNHRDLGQAEFLARTTGSNLNFGFNSDLAQSQIHASGVTQLGSDYITRGNLTFSNIRYGNIAPFISSEPTVKPLFDTLVEGQASVDGPLLRMDDLNGRLQLNKLDVRTAAGESPTGAPPARGAEIQNQGPIVIALNRSVVQIQQFEIQGPDSEVHASGAINLKNGTSPIGLNLSANVNLGVLQDISRDFYSSGGLALNAVVRGNFSQPLVNGRIELKNANINYAGAPNGISNGNGVILLNGTNATIQNLTGESGGGKIALTGFIGLANSALNYSLRASATKVRVRYSGISATSNAAINLVGNTKRSLLDGAVTVQRIAYTSTSDAGSILSNFASTPPSEPSAPSGLLAGMRLDIHILTAPDLRVTTTYANRLSVEADLTVRGTAITPGMLGRVTVTEGQLVFFGNTYTVNTGTINFYNPTSIRPVVNVSLETIAQGVDVTLGVTGPMDNLKLSYRSDPPLTFEQIVELLATNTTPADPNIAANQPVAAQQSFTQMGESAVLGQAVANPLASRVQRVFGLSQFKIDPSVSGSNGQPTARVTLQQKIFNNVTFTYIQDVTQSNSEIVRVEWDLTPKFSAVGLRDYNGNVSLEFFYKFKVR